MDDCKKYKISFFENCRSNVAREENFTFDELCKYLGRYVSRNVQVKGELEAMICGTFANKKRATENLETRSILTYDIDYYKHNLDALIGYLNDCLRDRTYIYYTTFSNTFLVPKVRVLLFIDKSITKEEYVIVSKNVAKSVFADLFDESNFNKKNETTESAIDKVSYSPMQLMYLPTHTYSYAYDKNIGSTITVGDYLDALQIKKPKETPLAVRFANTPCVIDEGKIKEILWKYDVHSTDRKSWLAAGQALHHQYKGSDKGYEIFLDWSLSDHRYSQEEIHREVKIAYESFTHQKDSPITFKTIMYIVKQNEESKKIGEKTVRIELPKVMGYDDFVHHKYDKKGNVTGIKSTYENFKKMCEFYDLGITYDVITKDILNNNDDQRITTTITSLAVLNNMKESLVKQYIIKLSTENVTNSFKNELDSIVWDGVKRFDSFAETLTVTNEYEEIKKLYLMKWLQQMLYVAINSDEDKKIARNILILKGEQNIGKTTWIKSLFNKKLANKYIGEGMVLNASDSMSVLSAIKFLIVELAELEQSFKASDINQFKSFFGRTKDVLNRKYIDDPVTYLRTTSFIGTINDDNFLKDKTGSTRFLVLPVVKTNGYHNVDMLQLYKEIIETTDYCNFELSKEELKKQQTINEEFSQINILEESFLSMFEVSFSEGGQDMNCTEVLQQIGFTIKDLTHYKRTDVANLLKKYNYKYKKNIKKWVVKLKEKNYANKIQ